MRQKTLLILFTCVLGWGSLFSYDDCDCNFVPYDPCCYPENTCCAESTFYLYGDWLYWRLRRTGIDYVIPDGDLPILGDSDIKKIPLDYENGFRIGGGFRDYCKQIDIGVRYTSFDFKRSGTYVDPEVDAWATRTSPVFALVLFGDGDVGYADSMYKLDYDTIDVHIGSYFELDCDSWAVPFVGVRFAFIDERMNTAYADANNFELADNAGYVFESLDLNAYGLSVGFDLHKNVWNRCIDVGLYGRAMFSMMLGEFDISHEEVVYAIPFNAPVMEVNSRCYQIVSSYELAAGLEIGLIECCEYSLSLAVGYEFNGWCNYADFLHFPDEVLQSALTRNLEAFGTDGLFLRVIGTY